MQTHGRQNWSEVYPILQPNVLYCLNIWAEMLVWPLHNEFLAVISKQKWYGIFVHGKIHLFV